jgi:hypothetical protein
MATAQSGDARDYSLVRDRIAEEFYRVAGVRGSDIPPTLGRDQIAELVKYADSLPTLSTQRREFKEGVRMSEESTWQRIEASRSAEPMRSQEPATRRAETHTSYRGTARSNRSDCDSFARDR